MLLEVRARDAERFGPTTAMLQGVMMTMKLAMMMMMPLMMIMMKHTSRCRRGSLMVMAAGDGGGRGSIPRDAAEVG